ncbi:hypothetical protein JCM1393_27950 [Clostridium carnis]
MKKYLKNNNFIPNGFIEKNNLKIKNSNRKAIIYLILLNIAILPLTLDKFTYIYKKEEEVTEEIIEIQRGIYIQDIVFWFGLIDKDVIELNILDGIGEIKVNSKEKIYTLEENYKLSIKSITQNNEGNFILGIN